jgi:hypothetical protein
MKLRVALLGAGNVTRAFLKYWSARQFGIDLRVVSVVRSRGTWHGDENVLADLEALDYRRSAEPFNNAQHWKRFPASIPTESRRLHY